LLSHRDSLRGKIREETITVLGGLGECWCGAWTPALSLWSSISLRTTVSLRTTATIATGWSTSTRSTVATFTATRSTAITIATGLAIAIFATLLLGFKRPGNTCLLATRAEQLNGFDLLLGPRHRVQCLKLGDFNAFDADFDFRTKRDTRAQFAGQ
jgi:hypothetical protein